MSFESKNTDETRNVLFDISLQLAIRFNIFFNKISQGYCNNTLLITLAKKTHQDLSPNLY